MTDGYFFGDGPIFLLSIRSVDHGFLIILSSSSASLTDGMYFSFCRQVQSMAAKWFSPTVFDRVTFLFPKP